MNRQDIFIVAGVALVVSLGVGLGLPRLQMIGSEGGDSTVGNVLASMPNFGIFRDREVGTEIEADNQTPLVCMLDTGQFVQAHGLDQDGWNALAPEEIAGLKETAILTPSRTNSYSLTEDPEYSVGYFAQRGSFQSAMFHEVAHIEVLTTFILHDRAIGRRNLANALRRGTGPTHGIFRIDYEGGGDLMGEWTGRTDAKGNIQGCFIFPPTNVEGTSIAGVGTYEQKFSQNETSIVTWTFDAVYQRK